MPRSPGGAAEQPRGAGGVAGDDVIVGDFGADVAQRDAMWRLVRDLPPRQRAVVVLRFYEDLDDAAIAAIMRCSAVTVRTQAMRALTTLRGRMDAGAQPTSLRRRHDGPELDPDRDPAVRGRR